MIVDQDGQNAFVLSGQGRGKYTISQIDLETLQIQPQPIKEFEIEDFPPRIKLFESTRCK